jgi:hypothetical protein
MPISCMGVMFHKAPRWPGTERVWPLAMIVQVSVFRLPEILRNSHGNDTPVERREDEVGGLTAIGRARVEVTEPEFQGLL